MGFFYKKNNYYRTIYCVFSKSTYYMWWRRDEELCPGRLRSCRIKGTFRGTPNCFLKKHNLIQEKGARMHFFKKLFGSTSNSRNKNNYALATLEYATGRRTYNNNALISGNQVPAFRPDSRYNRPVTDFTPTSQPNANNVINILNVGVPGLKQKHRITISSFKSFSSKTDIFIHRSWFRHIPKDVVLISNNGIFLDEKVDNLV